MATTSKFIVHIHDAKKAGKHWDIRFKMPNDKNWASFANKKEPSRKDGERQYIVRTNNHSEKEALMKGVIKDGYGAGTLKVWDEGVCIIHKYKNSHMIIEFKGRKLKGRYHFINTGVFDRKKNYKKKIFAFFKAKG